jgi:hypothetical protein
VVGERARQSLSRRNTNVGSVWGCVGNCLGFGRGLTVQGSHFCRAQQRIRDLPICAASHKGEALLLLYQVFVLLPCGRPSEIYQRKANPGSTTAQ